MENELFIYLSVLSTLVSVTSDGFFQTAKQISQQSSSTMAFRTSSSLFKSNKLFNYSFEGFFFYIQEVNHFLTDLIQISRHLSISTKSIIF